MEFGRSEQSDVFLSGGTGASTPRYLLDKLTHLNAQLPVGPGQPLLPLPVQLSSPNLQESLHDFTSTLQKSALATPQSDLPSQSRRRRKGQQAEGQPKRTRAKKPPDAPRRPKSAYMFFLAQFREEWKDRNPESKKVADMAVAAGIAWRNLDADTKAHYEELSTEAKAKYAVKIEQYQKDHPRPSRYEKVRDPAELKRPQSGYFFFLAEFRQTFKEENPGQAMIVKEMSKLAGEQWKKMTPEERAPYEELSKQSKQSYAYLKTLTPEERVSLNQNPGMMNPDQFMGEPGLHTLLPPASSVPLGVVPDAMHEHPHVDNSLPGDWALPRLSMQHVALVPDIKQEISYGFDPQHMSVLQNPFTQQRLLSTQHLHHQDRHRDFVDYPSLASVPSNKHWGDVPRYLQPSYGGWNP
eukprot:jgi/Botrbrau1/8639/Bobra.0196s0033.1